MDEKYELKYHQLEKQHFWFKARRKFILQLLNKQSKDKMILDIGCSSGVLLNELADNGFKRENLYGIDVSVSAIENCKKNKLNNVSVMDAQHITLQQKFDIIIASDCLEHLAKDEKALDNWRSLLNDNGSLYVFVPAFNSLWSKHDDINKHYRRYTKTSLNNKLKQANFEIIKSSYWNFTLFIPIFLMRIINKINPFKRKDSGDNLKKTHPIINNLLFQLINIENKFLSVFNFPFGVSVFSIVKRSNRK